MDLPAIAFIGAGNMGSAIISGLLRRDQVPEITVIDQSPEIRERHATAGCTVSDQFSGVADCPFIVLAVKPQGAQAVLEALAQILKPSQCVISIMAGITCSRIQESLPDGVAVIRAMPNTPMAVGRGMIGIAAAPSVHIEQIDVAQMIFASAGRILQIEESQMDALTAVSGSGPAYLFAFAESQIHAALDLGFSDEEAALLVGETLAGSIAYLQSQQGFPAAKLREQVTSPGGTTAAALQIFNDNNFTDLIKQAFHAACQRSKELSA